MNISARLQENVLRALLSVMIDFSVEISLMSQLINVVCSSSTFTSSKTPQLASRDAFMLCDNFMDLIQR